MLPEAPLRATTCGCASSASGVAMISNDRTILVWYPHLGVPALQGLFQTDRCDHVIGEKGVHCLVGCCAAELASLVDDRHLNCRVEPLFFLLAPFLALLLLVLLTALLLLLLQLLLLCRNLLSVAGIDGHSGASLLCV